MNANEIVKELREACTDNEYAPPMATNKMLIQAADLIESQQAQLVQKDEFFREWCSGEDQYQQTVSRLDCANIKIAELESQLAASQCREKAAVEDLKTVMPYWCCKNKSKEHCPVSSFNGMIDCAYCGDWEWRGPQEGLR